jgi:hypothetical protein
MCPPPVNHDFPSSVIWIYEVAMLCAEIMTFSFSSPARGYVAFYPVAKVPVEIFSPINLRPFIAAWCMPSRGSPGASCIVKR